MGLLHNKGYNSNAIIYVYIYTHVMYIYKCLLVNHSFPLNHDLLKVGIIIAPVLQISSREGSEHLPQISVTQPSRALEAYVVFCFVFLICTVQGHNFKLECFSLYINVCSRSLAHRNIRVSNHIHSVTE